MVVVVLIALLAVIAAPSMSAARADQMAFNFARRTSEMFHNGRARSAGRGAAHLVVFDGSERGTVLVFEGLDGTAPPTGPNPSSSCRRNGQWAFVPTYAPGGDPDAEHRARIVDGFTVNSPAGSFVVSDDIRMTASIYESFTSDPVGDVKAIALCTTPNGTTFVGRGDDLTSAIAALSDAAPFTGAISLAVQRHRNDVAVGLRRNVLLVGAAAPRIRSE